MKDGIIKNQLTAQLRETQRALVNAESGVSVAELLAENLRREIRELEDILNSTTEVK